MFGISLPELLFVFFIFLLVFGPDKLPDAARSFGKVMGVLKRNSDALRREFYNAVYAPAEDVKKEIDQARRELRAVKMQMLPEDEIDCEEKARREREKQSAKPVDSEEKREQTQPSKEDNVES